MSVHLINPHDFSRRGTYSPRSAFHGYMSATLKSSKSRKYFRQAAKACAQRNSKGSDTHLLASRRP